MRAPSIDPRKASPSAHKNADTPLADAAAAPRGTFFQCGKCDGCRVAVELLPGQTDACSPCTGCTHELYAIEGKVDFMDHEYPVRTQF